MGKLEKYSSSLAHQKSSILIAVFWETAADGAFREFKSFEKQVPFLLVIIAHVILDSLLVCN